MKLSTIRNIRRFCNGLHSTPDWREVVENLNNLSDDFEVNNVRFINASDIDRIQQAELEGDLYCLGCFNAWFLAGVTGIDAEVFEAMQKAEAYEAIGKLIVSLGTLEDLQQEYARQDGYGHHFNRYDGNEETLVIDGTTYYVFDNH